MADYWAVMEAKGQTGIINMNWLTMFADYRVPQALVYLGVLRYSDSLMQTLKNGETEDIIDILHKAIGKSSNVIFQVSCCVLETGEKLRSEAVPFGAWS